MGLGLGLRLGEKWQPTRTATPCSLLLTAYYLLLTTNLVLELHLLGPLRTQPRLGGHLVRGEGEAWDEGEGEGCGEGRVRVRVTG